jgi:DHA1 family tetracycline resistance protein-like MFS transporter
MVFGRLRKRIYLPGNARILALSATIWSLGGAMVNPYQSVFFYAVGADALFIGYLLATSSAITAAAQLVGGYIADTWGRRKVVIIFSFMGAASAFVYIFIGQAMFLIVPVMLAAIAGLYGPAFNAMLTDSMETGLRARGVASFTLITSLPSVFSPYFGGVLMDTFGTLQGLRLAFFMSGLFGVIGVSYRAMRIKETYTGNETKKKTLLQFLSGFIENTSYVLRNASEGAKRLLVYSILASAGTSMTVPYTSLYLVSALGLQPTFYGVLTNFAGLISVLLLLPAARIIERVGLRKSAIYASVSVPVNQLIFVRAKGTDDFVAWSAVGGASAALLGPSLTALQANLSPQERRGRLMALFSVFSLLPAIPAQIIGGYLYGSWGALTPFLASIPLFALATIILIRIKEPKAPEN